MIRRITERSQAGIINRARIHELLDEPGFEVGREYSDYHEGDKLLMLEAVNKR
jgi:hypothetical protein